MGVGAAFFLLCAGLAVWGMREEFLLLTFGRSRHDGGRQLAFSSYMPAYLAYTGAFIVPLAIAATPNR